MIKLSKRSLSILLLVFLSILLWYSIPVLSKGVHALTPFLIAFATAYLLRHPVMWLEKLLKLIFKKENKVTHTVSTVFVLILFYGFLALLVIVLTPNIISNVTDIAQSMPETIAAVKGFVSEKAAVFSEWLKLDSEQSNDFVNSFFSKMLESVQSTGDAKSLLFAATGLLSTTATTIVSIVIYTISTFVLLHDYSAMKQAMKKSLKLFVTDDTKYMHLCAFLHKSDCIVEKYISVKITSSFCLGIVAYIGFRLFGISYPMLMATIVAVTNIVPYLGPIVGAIPPILVGLAGGGFSLGLWVGIFILICQQIEGNILTPLLIGDALNISPIVVLMGIAVFGAMFGIPGMILGAPIAAIITAAAKGTLKAIETEKEKNKNEVK